MSKYRAVRGMVDVLPNDTALWQEVEDTTRLVLEGYGYSEIRLPLMESTALFARGIGEVTDIVEKEMYTFDDRNGDSLSLRPEGTAGCVRAAVQHNLTAQPQKLWYMGPMFRYERPQKGRQRQFHQLGVEAFGVASPDLDAELLLLCREFWRALGVDEDLTLELNSIGSPDARAQFRSALVDYLSQHIAQLDEDSQRRLDSNPLRILDSKSETTQEILSSAPRMSDYLDDESRADFDRLCALLDACGQPYTLNERLVRGLDYYNKTVFEWTTTQLGAQATVCGGGRYDGLVAQFGGRDTPGAGFAMGLERLVLLLKTRGVESEHTPDIYVITADPDAQLHAMPRVEALRRQLPHLSIIQHLGGGSFKSQFKRADKSGARFALVYGAEELQGNVVTLKYLRDDAAQQRIPDQDLATTIARELENDGQD